MYREREQESNTREHQERRENPVYREREQESNTREHQERRENPEYREREQECNTQQRRKMRRSRKFILEKYYNSTEEGPDNLCSCCGGLFFRRTVLKYTDNYEKVLKNRKHNFWDKVDLMKDKSEVNKNQKWFCITCSRYIVQSKIPRLSLYHGLVFHDVDPRIAELNQIEERLVSPRIPFIRIKPLGWDRQNCLIGNAVNVPVDVTKTLEQLPRQYHECEFIQLKFMRKMDHNNPYLNEGQVRRTVVENALKFLIREELFIKCGIHVTLEKIAQLPNAQMAIAQELQQGKNIEHDNDQNQNVHQNVNPHTADPPCNQDVLNLLNNDTEKKDDNVLDTYLQIHETLLVDRNTEMEFCAHLLVSQAERNNNSEESHKIAPGETSYPVNYLFDRYVEELSFLKIFGGKIMKITNADVTFGAKCKSFFRRYDRRCAKNIQYIFFMYRKLMASKLQAAIQMSLKRTEIGSDLTANQILNDQHLVKNYLSTETAKRFLQTIRSSPEYWNVKKKEIFSMIRQLGIPTFFITLSPAEIDWIELLIILRKIESQGEIILSAEEATKLKRDDRIELLKNDPVTTARYFENRVRSLITYMFNPNGGTFKEHQVIDYYWRVEFQTRGSPHIHMLVWLKDAPKYKVCEFERFKYDNEKNQHVYEFIEKYINTVNPLDGYVRNFDATHTLSQNFEIREEAVKISYQYHDHKINCIIDDESILGKDPYFKKPRQINENEDIPDSLDYRYNAQNDDTEDEKKEDDTDYFQRDIDYYTKYGINREDFRTFEIKCKYRFPHPILEETCSIYRRRLRQYDSKSSSESKNVFFKNKNNAQSHRR